ncbi:hypothetical protein BB561_001796 [Smittium simulii]|uniref:WDR59/RTC1-like RING zinc finger domain-containing protein n=1 Tax=Smittium simulii TaxID=133385 RepID=A0A2T9YT37_9FUNG|nr:hypothetical protein BB561_001796 [Smittium simulii]
MDAPNYAQALINNKRHSRENKRIFKKSILNNKNKSLSTPINSIPNLAVYGKNQFLSPHEHSLPLGADIKEQPASFMNTIENATSENIKTSINNYDTSTALQQNSTPEQSPEKSFFLNLPNSYQKTSSFTQTVESKNLKNDNIPSVYSQIFQKSNIKFNPTDSNTPRNNTGTSSFSHHRKSFDLIKNKLFKVSNTSENLKINSTKLPKNDSPFFSDSLKNPETPLSFFKKQQKTPISENTDPDNTYSSSSTQIQFSSIPTNLTKKIDSSNLEPSINHQKAQQINQKFYELNNSSSKSLYSSTKEPEQVQNKPITKVNSIVVTGGIIQNLPTNNDTDFIESLIKNNSKSARGEPAFLAKSLTEISDDKLNNLHNSLGSKTATTNIDNELQSINNFDSIHARLKHSKTESGNVLFNNSSAKQFKSFFLDNSSESHGNLSKLQPHDYQNNSKRSLLGKSNYDSSFVKSDYKLTNNLKNTETIPFKHTSGADNESLPSNHNLIKDKQIKDSKRSLILKNDSKFSAFNGNELGAKSATMWLNSNSDNEPFLNNQVLIKKAYTFNNEAMSTKHSASPDIINNFYSGEDLNISSAVNSKVNKKFLVEPDNITGFSGLHGTRGNIYTSEDKNHFDYIYDKYKDQKQINAGLLDNNHTHLELKSNSRWASFASSPNDDRLVILAGQEGLVMVDINKNPILKLSNLVGKQQKSVNMDFRDILWLPSNTVVTGSSSGSVLLWDPNLHSSLNPRAIINASNRAINRIVSQPECSSNFYCAFQDGYVMGFDERISIKSPKSSSIYNFKTGPTVANDISFDPTDKNNLAIASGNGRVGLWDLRQTKSSYFNILAHAASRTQCVSWNDNGQFLASGGSDGLICVWNISGTESNLYKFQSNFSYTKPTVSSSFSAFTNFYTSSHVRRISWRPGYSTQLASCSLDSDFCVNIWDMQHLNYSTYFHDRHTNAITSLKWRDKDSLWSCGNDGRFMECNINRDFYKISKHVNNNSVAVGLYDEIIISAPRSTSPTLFMDDYVGNQKLPLNALKDILTSDTNAKTKSKMLETLYKKRPSNVDYYPQRFGSSLREIKIKSSLGTRFEEISFFASNYIIESNDLNKAFTHNALLATEAGRPEIASDWEWLKFFFKSRDTICGKQDKLVENVKADDLVTNLQVKKLDRVIPSDQTLIDYLKGFNLPESSKKAAPFIASSYKQDTPLKTSQNPQEYIYNIKKLKRQKKKFYTYLKHSCIQHYMGRKNMTSKDWLKNNLNYQNKTYRFNLNSNIRALKATDFDTEPKLGNLGNYLTVKSLDTKKIKANRKKQIPRKGGHKKRFIYYKKVNNRSASNDKFKSHFNFSKEEMSKKHFIHKPFDTKNDKSSFSKQSNNYNIHDVVQKFFLKFSSKEKKLYKDQNFKTKLEKQKTRYIRTKKNKQIEEGVSDSEWEILQSTIDITQQINIKKESTSDLETNNSINDKSVDKQNEFAAEHNRSAGVVEYNKKDQLDQISPRSNNISVDQVEYNFSDDRQIEKLNQATRKIVIDLISHYADSGDFQVAATIGLLVQNQVSNKKLLDLSTNSQFRDILYSYIKLLDKLQLFSESTKILKMCNVASISNIFSDNTYISWDCNNCKSTCEKLNINTLIGCSKCIQPYNICSICNKPVLSTYIWCQGCGHGGHLEHFQSWFNDKKNNSCPLGCGHYCNFSIK